MALEEAASRRRRPEARSLGNAHEQPQPPLCLPQAPVAKPTRSPTGWPTPTASASPWSEGAANEIRRPPAGVR
jgi:hypothetical protein